MTIGRIGREWLGARKIRFETAARFGIYTAKWIGDGKIRADEGGNILVFPSRENEEVVGEQWRNLTRKGFAQRPGSKQVFWNAEIIEAAAGGELIITEGQIDALSAIECGFDKTVSVPGGAPQQPVEIDTDREGGKFAFLFEARRAIAEVKTFVLAVDNDENGRVLAAELVRRLSAARCKAVDYPDDCKDLNDVLMKFGPRAVVTLINNARPYPVAGLYGIDDYPDKPPLQTSSTGWDRLDDYLKPFPGELIVITGIPGHGKSSFACHLIVNLCQQNEGWTAAIFSPEMPVKPQLHDKLRRILIGRSLDDADASMMQRADDWIRQHLIFISADPSGPWDQDDLTLEWILDRATDAVHRRGIRVLLIDPWNEIEHCKGRDELMTEYIGRAVRELRHFAQQREVIVILIAHPTKEIAKDKRAPGLYDIDGSAHWANKPDHGVTVHLADATLAVSDIHVTKVRFGNTGKRGIVRMSYDVESERYGC